ncbi:MULTISPECIES: NIPSNAP family protein [Phyllobacteriaceae]|uniref:NIPSNAP family containing protein n=1 Tax=Mesorhizobium hungaricum TaxID=1566387 RepID=A0A1C2DHM3_9HYPH|nr:MULTISPECIES: NIPSNAP family protein [Mesorhizobium]MBN9235324.1 NIPSNAP family protein [Mesorhizobium sp.]MDQ0332755.1 hypothetical protein [Mesorhizobium sp. YL-MeA3-2017]OCX14270.1 NIPSNAP family containing protein [Mesorhizobium hungaricum]
MNTSHSATSAVPADLLPVIELRQYTLVPGQRETLIDIFDGNFVEPQDAAGMTVIGQFRDLDRPDMFVWLRGFASMDRRRQALAAFYDGPVWAAHRDAANATMIDSDNVLLLRPAWPGAGFAPAFCERAALYPLETSLKSNRNNEISPLVAATIHYLNPESVAAFVARFRNEAASLLAEQGATPLAAFVIEPAENSFPRLPVRIGETVFVHLSRFESIDAHARAAAAPSWRDFLGSVQPYETKPAEHLRLTPTSRSLLR